MNVAEFVQKLGIQPGEQDRVIIHWTGGGAFPTGPDKRAYHVLVDQNLSLHRGDFTPDDNLDTGDKVYAAHTLHANTRAVGLALCGMAGARENPLHFGSAPITEAQFELSAVVAAHILRAAALPCEPHTALSHAEVQETLGIRQRGKWDIAVLPWRADIRGARAIGDLWRTRIQAELKKLAPVEAFVSDPVTTLRMGNKTPSSRVKMLQQSLKDLGYFSGSIDGLFGNRTRAAVVAFQADNDIAVDGVVGPVTWTTLQNAQPRPERAVSEASLRQDGSRTIKGADEVKTGALAVGAGGSVLTILSQANEIGDAVAQSQGWIETALSLLANHWQVVIFIILCLFIWNAANKIVEARVDDARTGANDSK